MDFNKNSEKPNHEERQKIISDLTSFIGEHETKLERLMQQLNWTADKTMDSKALTQCSVDGGHFVTEESLLSHVKKCCMCKDKYTKEEQEEKYSLDWLYSKMKNVFPVKIDDQLQSNILVQATGVYTQKPISMTAEREVSTLTPHERALLHDHVVNAAKKLRSDQSLSEDLTADPQLKLKVENKEPTTYLELLAAQRDYKRRRQTYKGKSKGVTSNKKSQTEIMKEIIDIQMEELFEQSKANQNEKDEAGLERRKIDTHRTSSSKQSSREGSQCSSRRSNESSPQRNSPPRRSPHRKHRHRSRSPASKESKDYSKRKHKKHKHKEKY